MLVLAQYCAWSMRSVPGDGNCHMIQTIIHSTVEESSTLTVFVQPCMKYRAELKSQIVGSSSLCCLRVFSLFPCGNSDPSELEKLRYHMIENLKISVFATPYMIYNSI